MKYIIKRDGKQAPFNEKKIFNAIYAANKAVEGEKMAGFDIDYLTKKVCEKLDGEICTVEQVQDIVEQMLIKFDYEKTAKAYILYRAEHAQIRDAESDLMKIYNELTYSYSKDADIKRENANIDGDTSMGTMLKYGSEGAKYFVDNYVLPKDIAKAHIEGDIHIHDKDFYMLTETCVGKDANLKVLIDGEEKTIRAEELEAMFPEIKTPDNVCYVGGLKVLSSGRYVDVINVVSHDIKDKKLLRLVTTKGSLEVTSDHRVSVKTKDGISDIKAENISVGDKLVRLSGYNATDEVYIKIDSIEVVEDYAGRVYDMETEDHHFDANEFRVHNCCQIDPIKLFKDGFSTGHGYLREPQSIQSYASLACIAIQANQNEMHRKYCAA